MNANVVSTGAGKKRKKKKKAFTKYAKKYEQDANCMQKEIDRAKKYCQVIRAICHTQISKIKLRQKKAHIVEIQINGGSVTEKVDFCTGLFERTMRLSDVFKKDE